MLDFILLYGDRFLAGAAITLELTLVSVGLAAFAALPMALLRTHPSRWCRWPVRFFVSFFRGTPLIAQLFLLYYGAGQFRGVLTDLGIWWLLREPMGCAILTFALNSCAYQTEILRGGLQAVCKGEVEAGVAMGMSKWLLYRKIVLPHAYRIAFPALGNEFILMLKGGAIASVITVLDLMGQTRRVFSQTFDLSSYLVAALMYLMIASCFVFLWRSIERYLTRHLSPMQTVSAGPRTMSGSQEVV